MLKKIKKGIDDMSKTAISIISGIEKGIISLKDPRTRRIVGVIITGVGLGLGGSLIVSSYI